MLPLPQLLVVRGAAVHAGAVLAWSRDQEREDLVLACFACNSSLLVITCSLTYITILLYVWLHALLHALHF